MPHQHRRQWLLLCLAVAQQFPVAAAAPAVPLPSPSKRQQQWGGGVGFRQQAAADGGWAYGSDDPSDYVSTVGRSAPWFKARLSSPIAAR